MKTELISTIILVILVTVILTLRSKKERASYWKGELVKKNDFTDEDNENHMYRLTFKTEVGKKKKVTVKEELYMKSKIGDKFEKMAGEYIPKRLS
jgi:hypothetical protein